MPLVVDASVIACWILDDESDPVADVAEAKIVADSAIVPTLLWFELRNLIIVNERRGRLNPATSARALQLVRAFPLVVDADVVDDDVMRLARIHRLTVYDAAYLELARRRALPLATLDAALARAARAEAVVLIGPSTT